MSIETKYSIIYWLNNYMFCQGVVLMKIVNKILLGLLLAILLLTGFIVACFVNPELAKKVGNTLYNDEPRYEDDAYEDTDDDIEGYYPEDGENTDEGDNDYIGEEENNVDDVIDTTDDIDINEPFELPDTGNSIDTDSIGYDLLPDPSYPFNGMRYVAPEVSELDVPSQLQGKSGYELPKLTLQELDDPEADEIEETLGPGETGDGLDFQALFYPYYHMLDAKGKQLYRQIYANANALNQRFSPVVSCNSKEVSKAMQAVFCDHPELFWINTAYNLRCRRNGEVSEIDLSFNKTANDLPAAKEQFDNAANEILSTASQLGSDFEKEKYVHDVLADKIDYSLSAPMNQSAYSALVNDSTVCAGYARAMQYLMTKMGVPCYYCTGFAGENHAWNIINLGDDFYNVDVTWDDADPTNYDFFNKTDADYARNHVRKNLSVNLPPCNGTGYQVDSPVENQQPQDEYPDSTLEDSDSELPVLIIRL